MKITSIDIGIQHLGITVCEVDDDMTGLVLREAKLINIQDFNCNRLKCKLHHDRCFADWMAHVFQNYSELFDTDKILIERQPPVGLVAIEQLIFSTFRNKSILISPRSVHCFFKCGKGFDYDARKKHMIKITKKMMKGFTTPHHWDRTHDIADALAQTMFFVERERKKVEHQEKRDRIKRIQTTWAGKKISLCQLFKQWEYSSQPPNLRSALPESALLESKDGTP